MANKFSTVPINSRRTDTLLNDLLRESQTLGHDFAQMSPDNRLMQVAQKINGNSTWRNAFFDDVLNKIGLQFFQESNFRNPLLTNVKQQEFGVSSEEFHTDFIHPYEPSYRDAVSQALKMYLPPVSSVFHTQNYRWTFPFSMNTREVLRVLQPGHGDGLYNYLNSLFGTVQTSMEAHLYKACLAQFLNAYHNQMYYNVHLPVDPNPTEDAMQLMEQISYYARIFRFPNNKYNVNSHDNAGNEQNVVVYMEVETYVRLESRIAQWAVNFRAENPMIGLEIIQIDAFPEGMEGTRALVADGNFFPRIKHGDTVTDTMHIAPEYTNYFSINEYTLSVSPFSRCVRISTQRTGTSELTLVNSITNTVELSIVVSGAGTRTNHVNFTPIVGNQAGMYAFGGVDYTLQGPGGVGEPPADITMRRTGLLIIDKAVPAGTAFRVLGRTKPDSDGQTYIYPVDVTVQA